MKAGDERWCVSRQIGKYVSDWWGYKNGGKYVSDWWGYENGEMSLNADHQQ